MFKFLVICAVLVVVYGRPGIGHGYYGGYSALPSATSYSHRVDIHSPHILKTYAAPTLVAAPIISKAYVAPALSYHSAPLLSSSYGHGGHGYGLGHDYGLESYGLDHGLGHGLGHGLSHSYGGYGHGLGHGLEHGLSHSYGSYGHGW